MKLLITSLFTFLIFLPWAGLSQVNNHEPRNIVENTGENSEIILINQEQFQVQMEIQGYDWLGSVAWRQSLLLDGGERTILSLPNLEPNSTAYVVIHGTKPTIGLLRLGDPNRCRPSLSPVSALPHAKHITIPRIDSQPLSWTGLALVNTQKKTSIIDIHFFDAQGNFFATKQIALPEGGHNAFLIQNLFPDKHGNPTPQPKIASANIDSAEGIASVSVFGSFTSPVTSCTPLTSAQSRSLIFPQYAQTESWWSGVVLYNPSNSPVTYTHQYRNAAGSLLQEGRSIIEPSRSANSLLPVDIVSQHDAWLKVDADQPLIGYYLFGPIDQDALTGISAFNQEGRSGVFPWIKTGENWNGFTFINPDKSPSHVTFQALTDKGDPKATTQFTLAPYAKKEGLLHDFFQKADLKDATYLRYDSSTAIVAVQVSGNVTLQNIAAMSALRQQNETLYFPYIRTH